MLAACRRMLRRVFGNEKQIDALEEAIVKIEADIESGKKRVWTENEIISVLERTTDDCFVSEAYIHREYSAYGTGTARKNSVRTFSSHAKGGELMSK